MRTLCLLPLVTLALTGITALAQPASPGVGLRRGDLYTTAPVVLYVDPTGNDSKKCTSPGTEACATLGGARMKLPPHLRHDVTINVAVGTYGNGSFGGFQFTGLGDLSPTLTIKGTMSLITPATGTNTGTVTGSSNWVSGTGAVVTDSAQAWTTNDLRGRFIRFTSGTLSGNSYPIIGNTATTVSYAVFTGASVGSAYELVTPGTVFSDTSAHTLEALNGSGTFAVENVEYQRATGTVLQIRGVDVATSLTSIRTPGTGTGAAVFGPASITRSVLLNNGGSTTFTCFPVSTKGRRDGIACGLSASMAVNSGSGSAYAYQSGVGGTAGSATYLEANVSGLPVYSFGSMISSQNPSVWIVCTTAGAGVGVGGSVPAGSSVPPPSAFTSNGGLYVSGCATGVQVVGSSFWTALSPTFNNVTTAVKAERGGRLYMLGTPTFTGVTNEYSIDGTIYTQANISALSPKRVVGTNLSVVEFE